MTEWGDARPWADVPAAFEADLPRTPMPVVVRKLKNDGSERYRWEGDLVAIEPEWVVVHHDASRHVRLRAAGSEGALPPHGLRYLGRDRPLAILLRFDEDGSFLGAQCDAASPVRIEGLELSFVDLDVDLIVDVSGATYERDHDTFEENAVRLGYDEAARATVVAAMTRATQLVARRLPPFDGGAERLLASRLTLARSPGGR